MRSLIIAIVAATIGYTLSVIINSTVSAATLVGFGIEVGLGDRIQMTATEWIGLAGTYLPIYVGLHTVIFLLVHRFLPNISQSSDSNFASRRIVFAVSGAVSLLLLYIAFDTAMGLSGVLVASGRTLGGLIAHVATGAVSGLIFATFTNRPGEAAVSDNAAGS
jgi:hypothetical protein